MKRVSRLTLNTDEEQPGDDNARTPENVAGDHGGTPTDNSRDVHQAIPSDASLAPALPEYARLTDEQVAAAHQTGQWLDAFVAFASIASPLTPPAFHLAAGVFLGGVAIARRLYLDLNSSTRVIYSNLYLLYVGPSCRLTLSPGNTGAETAYNVVFIAWRYSNQRTETRQRS